MASKSSLKLSAIEDFFGKFYTFATTRGENHLESGHLRSFSYDPDTSSVRAKVLPSKRDDVYTVEVRAGNLLSLDVIFIMPLLKMVISLSFLKQIRFCYFVVAKMSFTQWFIGYHTIKLHLCRFRQCQ